MYHCSLQFSKLSQKKRRVVSMMVFMFLHYIVNINIRIHIYLELGSIVKIMDKPLDYRNNCLTNNCLNSSHNEKHVSNYDYNDYLSLLNSINVHCCLVTMRLG